MIFFFDQNFDRPNNQSIDIQFKKIDLSQNLMSKINQEFKMIIDNSHNIKYDKIFDFDRFFKKSDTLQNRSTPIKKSGAFKKFKIWSLVFLNIIQQLKSKSIILFRQK